MQAYVLLFMINNDEFVMIFAHNCARFTQFGQNIDALLPAVIM